MVVVFERKAVEGVEVDTDIDKRIIKGYAAVFGNVDLVGDIIEKGAFAKTIAEKFTGIELRSRIKTLYEHYQPIGLPTLMKEDDKGLYVEARVSKTAHGDEVLELIRDNVVDKMSIGFTIAQSSGPDESRGAKRVIQAIDLYEFGPVLWAANDETSVEAVKSMHAMNLRLKAGGLSKVDAEQMGAMLELLQRILSEYAKDTDEEEEESPPKNEEDTSKSAEHLADLKSVLTGFSGQLKSLVEQTNGVL